MVKKGQATLELVVILVTMLAFLAGITKIWFWMNGRIVGRQKAYNASRVSGGSSIVNLYHSPPLSE